ncbi:putative spermidine/putrescine transport system permease protein [Curtobacterium sp. PhB25]|uniref:ABC transporter permease n=1 Tax=unclassified Curtobacterium TaxID=257496 RepID=UPI00104657E3|nr:MULTISPECIES: ABC transporter permease subunit [unclassified Curtobacterium]TCU49694.1 putative spermidine/putrescine transport system permease protein [Curtobacterium sp. PhB146]TDW69052.1 putative spermidine/putrescine transport system permease protein [Curtobacterium sp. PhB25]
MTTASAGAPAPAASAPATSATSPVLPPSARASADAVRHGAGPRVRRRVGLAWLGLTPFAAYVLLFLAVPAVIAVGSGFFTDDGAFTLANLAAFAEPPVLRAFGGSFGLSAVSAVIGAVIGALVCWALSALRPDGLVRSMIDSAASVLAQFGGVMLAFAFIATIGVQGLVTTWLVSLVDVDRNATGAFLYTVPGLVIPYVYFQVPLMVLTFMPALEGVKTQWGEAAATLGASRATYWRRIALPVLAPAFWGSLLLLFANGFSSFATAAALISQGGIVPLTIRTQLTSETLIGLQNVAGVLAFGMVVVMAVVMGAYSLLQRRAARWQR